MDLIQVAGVVLRSLPRCAVVVVFVVMVVPVVRPSCLHPTAHHRLPFFVETKQRDL